MTKVAIIIGSTRPGRFAPQVAEWFKVQADKVSDTVSFEIVDIAAYNLPVLDEETPSGITKSHTKAWSEAISMYDGYVFVTAEYNHSVPGNFKNAVDFLNKEWAHKPVAYVSYGWAKGYRAVEAWRSIAAQFSQYDLREEVNIQLDGSGVFVPDDHVRSQALALVASISFWSEELKLSRAKLAA